ncbi:MAG: class I SAM-dependent methyltransferase family protein [Candidatus Woesearchaeota archaeon]|nr:class I SAM-dependent methyltransferase family protein [Candidatus Woesearchaeota archaeon]
MLGLQVSLEKAEQVKQYLIEHELFAKEYKLVRGEDYIVFPVIREFTGPFDFDVEFLELELEEKEQTKSLRDALWEQLNEEEREHLRTAFDTVGSIAIIDIPSALEKKEQLIGETLLSLHPSLKTVLKKVGGHTGTFRTQQMACIAGEDVRETTVTENGARLKVNVETAYYSVRMATERKRICEKIQPGEHVLCLFSGVGPYPIVFSKHSQAAELVGIEINPSAHELAVENVSLNRCANVHVLCGDAHELLPKFSAEGRLFDRVTMPLPLTGVEYLDDVLSVCKKGATVHFYSFQHENEKEKAVELLRTACRRNNKTLESFEVINVGQQSPRVFRVCVDGKIS